VDFVQDDAALANPIEKALRILHHSTYTREFTVKIFGVRQGLREACFPHPAHASQPGYGALPPGPFNEL
jgi:hypothetical protein